MDFQPLLNLKGIKVCKVNEIFSHNVASKIMRFVILCTVNVPIPMNHCQLLILLYMKINFISHPTDLIYFKILNLLHGNANKHY